MVDGPLRGGRARRRRRRGRPDGRRSPRPTCRARRARSPTARCRSSAASRSRQEHPAHRFLRRIVVREQQFGDARPPRARARASARGDAAAASAEAVGCARIGPLTMTTGHGSRPASTIRPPSAWSAIDDRRRPGHRRPAARGCPARSALAELRRRAHLRRQVEPHLSRRLRRRRGRPAPPAARAHPSHRARHGPRVPRAQPRSMAPPCPVPRVLHLGDADGAARRAVLRDGARRRPRLPQRSCPPGYADTPDAARGDRRARSSTTLAALHTVDPAERRARGLRPPGRLHGAPAAPLVEAVGGARRRTSCRRSTRLRDDLVRDAAATARSARSSTATTGSTTRSCIRRRPARSSPCSTGR